jgi:hypothetical protein
MPGSLTGNLTGTTPGHRKGAELPWGSGMTSGHRSGDCLPAMITWN